MSLTTERHQQFNLSITKDGRITCSTYAFPLDEASVAQVFRIVAEQQNSPDIEKRLLNTIRGIKLRRLATYLEDKPGILHGPFREYHANGILHRKEEYFNGLRHGLSETRSKTGQLLSVIQYKFGQRNGIHEEYDEKTGLLLFRGLYKNGQYHGAFQKRHKNGTLHAKGTYHFDQLHGAYECRDTNNIVQESGNYTYGIRTGLWRYPQNKGREYVWYNDNGQEISFGTNKNDVLADALRKDMPSQNGHIQLEF